MSKITPFVDGAIAAISEIQQKLKETPKEVLLQRHTKGAGGDISLGVDIMCERVFAAHLLALGTIYSEESGVIKGDREEKIILDPLDGSDNFTGDIPYYGASLALYDQDQNTKAALVVNYCTSEIFFRDLSYQNGQSFVLCDKRLAPYCADHKNIPKVGLFEAPFRRTLLAQKVHEQGLKFRSPGALALSLAYAKHCRFVIYCGRLRMYDIEAGLFIADDLHCYRNEEMLLLAQQKSDFEQIKEMMQQYAK